jgi:hypothetical protein
MSLLDLADDAGIELRLLQAAHEVNLRLHAPVPFHRRETGAPDAGSEFTRLAV